MHSAKFSGGHGAGDSLALRNFYQQRKRDHLDRLIRRTYGWPALNFSGKLIQNIYWCLRSIHFKILYSDPDIPDLDEMPYFNSRPPPLQVLCRRTKFTKNQLKHLYQAFKAECPNGRMTSKEFSKIYAYFFPNALSDEYSKRVFNALDRNNEGTIVFEDMAIRLSELWYGTNDQRIFWAFTLLDRERAGEVDFRGFLDFLTSIFDLVGQNEGQSLHESETAIEPTIDKEVVQRACELFKKLDIDKDGKINWIDFCTACQQQDSIIQSSLDNICFQGVVWS